MFEAGKTYTTRSICDYDTVFSYTVVARTAKTVTIKDQFGDVRSRRVQAHMDGGEMIYPNGKYSMCPVLTA